MDFKKLAFRGVDLKFLHAKRGNAKEWLETTYYIDFEKLGYKGDPVLFGGRFKQLPLGWRLVSQEE